jgi:hypothetical protein
MCLDHRLGEDYFQLYQHLWVTSTGIQVYDNLLEHILKIGLISEKSVYISKYIHSWEICIIKVSKIWRKFRIPAYPFSHHCTICILYTNIYCTSEIIKLLILNLYYSDLPPSSKWNYKQVFHLKQHGKGKSVEIEFHSLHIFLTRGVVLSPRTA